MSVLNQLLAERDELAKELKAETLLREQFQKTLETIANQFDAICQVCYEETCDEDCARKLAKETLAQVKWDKTQIRKENSHVG